MRIAEEIRPPRNERVPVVRRAECRYCDRYGHACGRHEETK